MSKVTESAPANIALIKYMGKTSSADNTPTNPSLSWSLSHLVTEVEIESSSGEDRWEPLVKPGFDTPCLSEKGQQRFLKFASHLKSVWGVEQSVVIRSANNFPADCGIASSASSFAALTKAMYAFARAVQAQAPEFSLEDLSRLSREGSGSSCRSLFPGWAIWENQQAHAVEYPIPDVAHSLILLSEEKKTVSSSEAHRLVATSPRFKMRPERAKARLQSLDKALRSKNWVLCYGLVRDEYIDMHELFETSEPAFSYRTDESKKADTLVQTLWREHHDGPIITMDAGPNVHLLWRPDQLELAKEFHKKILNDMPSARLILSPHFMREL